MMMTRMSERERERERGGGGKAGVPRKRGGGGGERPAMILGRGKEGEWKGNGKMSPLNDSVVRRPASNAVARSSLHVYIYIHTYTHTNLNICARIN